jgi:pre-mRNA 3'-end-processing factor FIP1
VVSKPVVKKGTPIKGATHTSGADLPGISTSKIDVNAKPIYEPAGKPITQVNIDEGVHFYTPFSATILIVQRSP